MNQNNMTLNNGIVMPPIGYGVSCPEVFIKIVM